MRIAEALEKLYAAYDQVDRVVAEMEEACARTKEILPREEMGRVSCTLDTLRQQLKGAADARLAAEQNLATLLTEGLPVH
jgi:hypothetical protein